MTRFSQWLINKWQPPQDSAQAHDYYECFSTAAGQRVLQHLIDGVYASVCPLPADAIALATHNGRRSVVHEILENFDMVANAQKYQPPKPEADTDVRLSQ